MDGRKGKFIVIDGPDGVGKATQVGILIGRLLRNGYQAALVDFPKYGSPSATMVEAYLAGKYGSAEEVEPRVASIFYAVDRFDTKREIEEALKEGKVVVGNRYTASNMGHQGGKIKDPEERKKFWRWLYELEFSIFKIPKPDLTLILYVPAELAFERADSRARQETLLLKKTKDIHESEIEHLRDTAEAYQELARTFPEDFLLIECANSNEIFSPESVGEKVWAAIEPILES